MHILQRSIYLPAIASAIAARNSSSPSPFSDEVASTSGKAAGRFDILASDSEIRRGTPAALILSVLGQDDLVGDSRLVQKAQDLLVVLLDAVACVDQHIDRA